MDRSIPLLLIGLFFGGGIGFVAAAGSGVTLDGHDHRSHHQHAAAIASSDGSAHKGPGGTAHKHGELLSVPEGVEAPTLAVDVVPDPVAGWNLHIRTTNFRFAPEHASREHRPGEGHAHVYVNGRKIARQYGAWMHIADLPRGISTVEVSLNSNDHRPLAVGSEPLAARVTVETR